MQKDKSSQGIVLDEKSQEQPKDKERAKIMVDFVKWALTDGQKYCAELGYAPLPEAVVKLEMAALAKIKIS